MNTARILLAAILILAAGIVHGAWTNRWGAPETLTELGDRLAKVPMNVETWTGEDLPVDLRTMQQAGADAYLSRRYVDTATGAAVSIMLVAGLPSHIAAHTPDVCYPGAGFALGGFEDVRFPLPSSEATESQFSSALAQQDESIPDAQRLRLFWAWSDGSDWEVPSDPRWTYANRSSLCKLYVVREATGPPSSASDDPSVAFLKSFLPVLDRTLFEQSLSRSAD